MRLVEALNISKIATLKVPDGRYYATQTRMYWEGNDGQSEEIHSYANIVIVHDWEPMGYKREDKL
jgi:hypothetical protein